MPVALAALMKERKKSQAELCRAAGVSPGAVSRYLSGGRGRRVDDRGARALEKLALALGVEPDYFREYRAWRIRQITFASPGLMDDFYDLVVEVARARGFLAEGADDEKKSSEDRAEPISGIN